MTDIAIEDSLVPLGQQDNNLSAYLNDLRESVREKADFDYKQSKQARILCQKLKKDFDKISKKIREQNEKSTLLLDYARKIGDEKGIMNKLGATGKLFEAALSKIPGVKQTKNMIKNPGHVSTGLEEQLKLTIEINKEIHGKLFSDEGLELSKTKVRENCAGYLKHAVDLTKKYKQLDSDLSGMKEQRDILVDSFLEKHGIDNFDLINLSELEVESLEIYKKIKEDNLRIEDAEFTINEHKDMAAKLINQYDGSEKEYHTLCNYLILGRGLYEKIEAITNNVGNQMGVISSLTTLDSLLTEGGSIATDLMENFNEIFETTAKHAERLAKENENIVPNFVFKGVTLKNVEESNNKSIEYLKNNGQLRKYQRALSGADEDPMVKVGYNQEDK